MRMSSLSQEVLLAELTSDVEDGVSEPGSDWPVARISERLTGIKLLNSILGFHKSRSTRSYGYVDDVLFEPRDAYPGVPISHRSISIELLKSFLGFPKSQAGFDIDQAMNLDADVVDTDQSLITKLNLS